MYVHITIDSTDLLLIEPFAVGSPVMRMLGLPIFESVVISEFAKVVVKVDFCFLRSSALLGGGGRAVLITGFVVFVFSTLLFAVATVKFVTDIELVTGCPVDSIKHSSDIERFFGFLGLGSDMSSHSSANCTAIISTATNCSTSGRASITLVGGGDFGKAGNFCVSVSVFCSKLPSGSALPSGSPCNSRDFSAISLSLTVSEISSSKDFSIARSIGGLFVPSVSDDSREIGDGEFEVSVLVGKEVQLLTDESLLLVLLLQVVDGLMLAGAPNFKAANDFLIFSCGSPNKLPLFILKSVFARVIRFNSTVSSSSLTEILSSSPSFAKFIKS
uniref:Uncharacterized protein n=1 Tax=Glossina brevipalpis TaxID=37001 RepID=A0A1A9WS25_9MUSC